MINTFRHDKSTNISFIILDICPLCQKVKVQSINLIIGHNLIIHVVSDDFKKVWLSLLTNLIDCFSKMKCRIKILTLSIDL